MVLQPVRAVNFPVLFFSGWSKLITVTSSHRSFFFPQCCTIIFGLDFQLYTSHLLCDSELLQVDHNILTMACAVAAAFTGASLLGENTISLESLSKEEIVGNEDSLMWADSAAAWAGTSHHNKQLQPLIRPWISKSPKLSHSFHSCCHRDIKQQILCKVLSPKWGHQPTEVQIHCLSLYWLWMNSISFLHFDIRKGSK